MPIQPQLWHIYFCENCSHAQPIKDKFVVIVHIDKNPMGFFINSKIRVWLQNQPDLLPCEAQISSNEHACLKHNSFVDCQSFYEFFDWELKNPINGKTKVSDHAKATILKAIQDCPTIKRKYKMAILRREGIE